jgi:hypothetical protein
MNHNVELIQTTDLLTKQYRPLDLGEYSSEYAGKIMQVWVNAPALLETVTAHAGKDRADQFASYRAVVSLLLELPLETVCQFDDPLLLWMFTSSNQRYADFHAGLKKKSPDSSTTTTSE